MRWLIALFVVGPCIANAQTDARTPKSALTAIAAADAEWLDAMRKHDVSRIVAPYDSDAVFITANGTVIRGRERIADLYRARLRNIARVSAGGIVRIGTRAPSDSLVYEWGHGGMTYADSTDAEHTSSGPYLTVWRRTRVGTWLIIRNLVF